MDDLISIREAIDALEKEKPTPFVNKDGSVDPFGAGRQNQWSRDGIAIMNLPTVDAVPVRHGKWIQFPTLMAYKCSECGRVIQTTDGQRNVSKHYPFCHCGAKMDGKDGDNGKNP